MRFSLIALSIMLLLASCKSREPDYYTLFAVNGTPVKAGKLTIKVQRPGLDRALDRPQLARQDKNLEMKYDTNALWSEPLDRMVERVVADDLAARLPASAVITESGRIEVHPDYQVEMEIRQFGIDYQNQAVIRAVLLVHKPGQDAKPHPLDIIRPASIPARPESVTLSYLLADVADRILQEILHSNALRKKY